MPGSTALTAVTAASTALSKASWALCLVTSMTGAWAPGGAAAVVDEDVHRADAAERLGQGALVREVGRVGGRSLSRGCFSG
ncbi:hypothetical protein [Nonomuraea rubra]|uniref:Secreted protein n=1 Tax=Nonomuraea rubra TaxID=46180 RepID=A0A7X0TXK3_9ACTN|nr:hypothetical protein [Nonomuraea rubra]MBB6547667.1 hypothetical protein [Nonomuraea rubra]